MNEKQPDLDEISQTFMEPIKIQVEPLPACRLFLIHFVHLPWTAFSNCSVPHPTYTSGAESSERREEGRRNRAECGCKRS